MLPSGNDASIVLAQNFGCILYFDSIGKSEMFNDIHSVDVNDDVFTSEYTKLFINEMNKLALFLNLKNTNYTITHGLPNKNNKSSCYD